MNKETVQEVINILGKVRQEILADCESFYKMNPDADGNRRKQCNIELDAIYRAMKAVNNHCKA